jgi:transcriptional regulator with XRE-family HTH domain
VTLGNAIKLIRTAKGIKQLTLASQLGVSPNYISLVEKDKREPSIGFIRKLATSLEVPVGLFFLWQDASNSKVDDKNIDELKMLLLRIQAMYIRNGEERDKDAA